MSNELTAILSQYGLDPTSAPGAMLSAEMNGTAAPAPRPPQGGVPADPAVGGGPVDAIQQAIDGAKLMASQLRAPVHSAAQTVAKAPGVVGAVGATVAQATAPQAPRAAPAPQPVPVASMEMLRGLILRHESSGDYTALNTESPGNTASGGYQYIDGTWGGYGGYAKAMLAPRDVQDRRAGEDINKGLARYGNDPYKVIASHYIPASAKNPQTWAGPYKLPSGKMVAPVAAYVRKVVANSPLQEPFNAYLEQYSAAPN